MKPRASLFLATGLLGLALSRARALEPLIPPASDLPEGASGDAAPSKRPDRFFGMSEPEISRTLKTIHAEHPDLRDRVAAVSAYFLGTPYKLGPLGEGEKGEFDRDPLINFKAVDCTTMIEQTMALSLEPDLKKAIDTLRKIRYRNGKISYQTRNHFPEIDWIPNNVAAGFLKDSTQDVGGETTRWAAKRISKRDWYAGKKAEELQGFDGISDAERQDRLKNWRALGNEFADQISSLPYVSIDLLPQLLDKIPSGTIANLVREDRPDKPILISHQVLIIDEGGVRYVRHASSRGQVEDVPALAYFYRYFNSPWHLLGVNLNQIGSPNHD